MYFCKTRNSNLQLTLSHVGRLVTITELNSFVNTSGSTGGDSGTEDTLRGSDLNLNSGVTTGVENLTSEDLGNSRHIKKNELRKRKEKQDKAALKM